MVKTECYRVRYQYEKGRRFVEGYCSRNTLLTRLEELESRGVKHVEIEYLNNLSLLEVKF